MSSYNLAPLHIDNKKWNHKNKNKIGKTNKKNRNAKTIKLRVANRFICHRSSYISSVHCNTNFQALENDSDWIFPS